MVNRGQSVSGNELSARRFVPEFEFAHQRYFRPVNCLYGSKRILAVVFPVLSVVGFQKTKEFQVGNIDIGLLRYFSAQAIISGFTTYNVSTWNGQSAAGDIANENLILVEAETVHTRDRQFGFLRVVPDNPYRSGRPMCDIFNHLVAVYRRESVHSRPKTGARAIQEAFGGSRGYCAVGDSTYARCVDSGPSIKRRDQCLDRRCVLFRIVDSVS